MRDFPAKAAYQPARRMFQKKISISTTQYDRPLCEFLCLADEQAAAAAADVAVDFYGFVEKMCKKHKSFNPLPPIILAYLGSLSPPAPRGT